MPQLAAATVKGKPKPDFSPPKLDSRLGTYLCADFNMIFVRDQAAVEKISKALSINLPNHILRSKDPRSILSALFSAWIPLSTAVLVSVIEHLPSPREAQRTRTSAMLEVSPGAEHISIEVRNSMEGLKAAKPAPAVAFVSKMVAVPEADLPQNKTRGGRNLTADEARDLGRKKRAEIARAQAGANGEHPDVAELRETLSISDLNRRIGENSDKVTSDEDPPTKEKLIGFARLFSGTLEVGDELYALPPKFNPGDPHAAPEPQKVTITALYLLMGRELEPLTTVPPGVVFGIAGLEGHIMKSGTLCSQLEGAVNLAGVSMGGQPIVRVALEPDNPQDLNRMVVGMRLLEQSDPCAKYEVLENGEHVILTAGELHLERCLKDLRERYARCEIQMGAPIVPYRESIISAVEMNPPRNSGQPRGTASTALSSRRMTIRLRVRPLPTETTEYITKNAVTVRELYSEQEPEYSDDHPGREGDNSISTGTEAIQRGGTNATRKLRELNKGLHESFSNAKGEHETWKDVTSRIVAFGPRRNGPNVLIDATPDQCCKSM